MIKNLSRQLSSSRRLEGYSMADSDGDSSWKESSGTTSLRGRTDSENTEEQRPPTPRSMQQPQASGRWLSQAEVNVMNREVKDIPLRVLQSPMSEELGPPTKVSEISLTGSQTYSSLPSTQNIKKSILQKLRTRVMNLVKKHDTNSIGAIPKGIVGKRRGQYERLNSSARAAMLNKNLHGMDIRVSTKKYQLLKLIARGGFGSVYGAVEKKPGLVGEFYTTVKPTLAIKICELDEKNLRRNRALDLVQHDKHLIGNEVATEPVSTPKASSSGQQVATIGELSQEIEVMNLLSKTTGRYTVSLIESFEYVRKQQVWLVMKMYKVNLNELSSTGLFEGDTRDARLGRISVLHDVARALVHMKSLNVIHRDIKPSNVLVDITGEAKLCDFGLAIRAPPPKSINKARKYALKVTTPRGSPDYMAPEVLQEGSKFDYAIDVWSFGVLVFSVYHRGESIFDQYESPKMHVFRPVHWTNWKQSNADYYNVLLGTEFLSERERRHVNDGEEMSEFMNRHYKSRRAKVMEVSDLVRSCLVPRPIKKEDKVLLRKDVAKRCTIEHAEKYLEKLKVVNKLTDDAALGHVQVLLDLFDEEVLRHKSVVESTTTKATYSSIASSEISD